MKTNKLLLGMTVSLSVMFSGLATAYAIEKASTVSAVGSAISATFSVGGENAVVEEAPIAIYEAFGVPRSACLTGISLTKVKSTYVANGKKACNEHKVSFIVSVTENGSEMFDEIVFKPNTVKKEPKPSVHKVKDSKSSSLKNLPWKGEKGDGKYYFKRNGYLTQAANIIRAKTSSEKGYLEISKCLFDGSKDSFVHGNPNLVRRGASVNISDAVNCSSTYSAASAFFNSYEKGGSNHPATIRARQNIKGKSNKSKTGSLDKSAPVKVATVDAPKYSKRVGTGATSSKKRIKKLKPRGSSKSHLKFSDATGYKNPQVTGGLVDPAYARSIKDNVIAGVSPSESGLLSLKRLSFDKSGDRELKVALEKQISEKNTKIVSLESEIRSINKKFSKEVKGLNEEINGLNSKTMLLYGIIACILTLLLTLFGAYTLYKRNAAKMSVSHGK